MRIVALAVLIPLTGMIVGLYLSALAVLPEAADDRTTKTLFRAGQPLPAAAVTAVAGGVVGLAHLVRAGRRSCRHCS